MCSVDPFHRRFWESKHTQVDCAEDLGVVALLELHYVRNVVEESMWLNGIEV